MLELVIWLDYSMPKLIIFVYWSTYLSIVAHFYSYANKPLFCTKILSCISLVLGHYTNYTHDTHYGCNYSRICTEDYPRSQRRLLMQIHTSNVVWSWLVRISFFQDLPKNIRKIVWFINLNNWKSLKTIAGEERKKKYASKQDWNLLAEKSDPSSYRFYRKY